MRINIVPKVTCITRLLQEMEVTKPQQTTLNYLTHIVKNAQSSAFSFQPQPTFTYADSISSALAEKLTPRQVEMLAEVGIELTKTPGRRSHQVKMTFKS